MKTITSLILGSILLFAYPQHPDSVSEVKTTKKPMLLGPAKRSDLVREPYKSWFNEEYEEYEPDPEALDLMKTLIEDVEILLFMGTWCSDSRREIPRVYKILDYLNFPDERISLIGVDREKESPGVEEKGMNIHHVPTIIFYREGQEIGRIIESPVETLEEDFGLILLGLPYTPHYEDEE